MLKNTGFRLSKTLNNSVKNKKTLYIREFYFKQTF